MEQSLLEVFFGHRCPRSTPLPAYQKAFFTHFKQLLQLKEAVGASSLQVLSARLDGSNLVEWKVSMVGGEVGT